MCCVVLSVFCCFGGKKTKNKDGSLTYSYLFPTALQVCDSNVMNLPHETLPSSQVVYNLSGVNVETYLAATANDFIRNRCVYS